MNARFFVGVFGNVAAFLLFFAPAATFKWIIENGSTEKFSGIPYVTTLLNNLLSAWYGLPFVSTNNFLVVTINGTGAVFESFYVLVFLTFAPKNEKLVIGGLLFLILLIFGGVVYFSLFVVPDNKRKTFCGCAAGACSIIMYLSPLFIMKSVIETKSVEYMPFFLSLFCFLCATSWFIYGLLGQDRFLYVPNGIGSALGAVQLILYFIYYDKKGSGNTLQIFKDGKSFNTQSSLIALV